MKYAKILALCMLILNISGCGGLSKKISNDWLETKTGPVVINMTGKWDSGGVWTGGWGEGVFVQEGRKFSGTMGWYYVDGVVSGDHLYMVLYSGKKVYYTAHLKKDGEDHYIGKATYKVIVDNPDSEEEQVYVMYLKKML